MRSDPASARRWLEDIRSHIELVERFIGDTDYDGFSEASLRFYAVTRCLEIISEASRRLPESLKARHPSILRKEMAGAGNVYRHGYKDVAAYDVLITIQDHLPALRAVVDVELAAVGS